MSRRVTIAGRSVERTARVLARPWAASFGIIFLLHWLFDTDTAVDAAVQRQSVRCARADRVAVDQTPPVYSASLVTHAGQHSYGSTAARAGWVSLVGYPQWVTAHQPTDPPVPQCRQRRRPSMLAISAALHGGLPR
jgi:hypothetical protein